MEGCPVSQSRKFSMLMQVVLCYLFSMKSPSLYPFERHYLYLSTMSYAYAKLGDEKNHPLLFLHNGGGDHRCWSYQLEYFADQGYHCVAMDLPGHGESAREECPYTLSYFTERVLSFIDHYFREPTNQEGVVRAVSIVGYCIGAAIALEIALKYPQKVKQLILVNLCAGPPGMSGAVKKLFLFIPPTRYLQRLFFFIFNKIAQTEFSLQQSLKELFFDPYNTENRGINFEKDISSHPGQEASRRNLLIAIGSFGKFSKAFDLKNKNQSFNCTLIWGEQNRVMSLAIGHWLSEYLTSPLMIVPQAKHMVMSEKPDLFNQWVLQALQAPANGPSKKQSGC